MNNLAFEYKGFKIYEVYDFYQSYSDAYKCYLVITPDDDSFKFSFYEDAKSFVYKVCNVNDPYENEDDQKHDYAQALGIIRQLYGNKLIPYQQTAILERLIKNI